MKQMAKSINIYEKKILLCYNWFKNKRKKRTRKRRKKKQMKK